ncbi:MAG: polyhydroxyalkanoate synthesis regulator DNA-binding domain-containing protein [Deltaproteobacteria bacterium]
MMPRVVKRYTNRKLYDTATSRYVSLDDVAGFVRAGEEVQVIENVSGEDLTAVTLAQIILEDERQKRSFVSLPLLRDLVRGSGDAIADATRQATEVIDDFRAKAEERVSALVNEGASRRDAFLDTIERSRKSLDDLQTRIDEGVKESFDRFRDATGIGSELERLETAMKEIEERIRAMLSQGGEAPGSSTAAAAASKPEAASASKPEVASAAEPETPAESAAASEADPAAQ